jgi:RsiW-degrading membrane proteinase PrsW (M82 family)
MAPLDVREREKSWRGNGYWLLLLMMIPLAVLTFRPHLTLEQRLHQTMRAHPAVQWGDTSPDKLTSQRLDEMIDQLPGRRLDGALLSRTSVWHWLMALAAAGVFTLIVSYALPTGIRSRQIFLTGLFTGTLGVLTLLGIQFFGMFCCIGLFYAAALSSTAPFGPSLLGFVLGIGICEETVKCLPILWILFRGRLLNWREACIIGMASGAGFGISEGILYSTRYYNGIEPAGMYVVRFCSSVALHTLLTGACALLIQRKQEHLLEKMDPLNWTLTLLAIIFIPIVLHGLFDTLAKQHLIGGSLLVAVGSFAWLAWLIRQARTREMIDENDIEAGPRIIRTEKGTRYIAPAAIAKKN